MIPDQPRFEVRVAESEEDLLAARRLRYVVFVEELGGDGALVDHQGRFEQDRFDPFCRHMILIDHQRDAKTLDHVVGVYRLMTREDAKQAGQFYCADEYDLAPLLASRRPLLELGRSCLHADYRGGSAMYHLWNGLADFTLSHGIEVLFGVASFHGTDLDELAEPLANLHHRFLAPDALRVRTQPSHYVSLDRLPAARIDRVRAMKDTPALIKGYLRLGGFVGDGAFIDYDFNTIDVFLVLDTLRMNARQRAIYTGALGAAAQ